MKNILIVGMGNTLRRDDGFGVEAVKKLEATGGLPPGVKVIEVGIAGISLVQELMARRYDALLIIDTVHRNGKAGTIYFLQAAVPETSNYTQQELHMMMTEPHTTEPSRALVVAKALGVLPPKVFIVACEPEDCDELIMEMSEPVKQAVDEAVSKIQNVVMNLQQESNAD